MNENIASHYKFLRLIAKLKIANVMFETHMGEVWSMDVFSWLKYCEKLSEIKQYRNDK